MKTGSVEDNANELVEVSKGLSLVSKIGVTACCLSLFIALGGLTVYVLDNIRDFDDEIRNKAKASLVTHKTPMQQSEFEHLQINVNSCLAEKTNENGDKNKLYHIGALFQSYDHELINGTAREILLDCVVEYMNMANDLPEHDRRSRIVELISK